MSICRFSSDDWASDVYVYVGHGLHNADCYFTHVARRRHQLPKLPPAVRLERGFTDEQFKDWWHRERQVMDMVSQASAVPIGLPHDGEDYEHDNPGDCLANLIRLQEVGYHVPAVALEVLREEIEEHEDA